MRAARVSGGPTAYTIKDRTNVIRGFAVDTTRIRRCQQEDNQIVVEWRRVLRYVLKSNCIVILSCLTSIRRKRVLCRLQLFPWFGSVSIDHYTIGTIPVGGEYTGLRSRRRKIRDDTWFHLVEIRVFVIKREIEQPATQATSLSMPQCIDMNRLNNMTNLHRTVPAMTTIVQTIGLHHSKLQAVHRYDGTSNNVITETQTSVGNSNGLPTAIVAVATTAS